MEPLCLALMMLAKRVHENGQKVVLTGEGADEWLAGYPWYKIAKIFNTMDVIPGLKLSDMARRAFLKLNQVPHYPATARAEWEAAVGGPNAWIDSYGVLALSKRYAIDLPVAEFVGRVLYDDANAADLVPELMLRKAKSELDGMR